MSKTIKKLLCSFCVFLLCFDAVNVFAQTYPQFDISGYKKWQYQKLNVNPVSNFYAAQSLIGGLINTSLGPWQERLSLKIESKINEKLSVSYDIQQEPESPQKSNVFVRYDNFLLSFGEFSAVFSENEFISANKYVDGVMIDYDDGVTKAKIVPSSKSKSYNQPLTSAYGNNTRGPYSLGRAPILEYSEKIWVNDKLQTRGKDYTIDYFEGKVTFTNILTPTDIFSYTYEYTNIVDLFFPTISKRDFFGAQASTTINNLFVPATDLQMKTLVSKESLQVFPSSSSESSTEEGESQSQGIIKLQNYPVVEFSENIEFEGRKLKKLEDYSINYLDGTIVLFLTDIPTASNPLKVSYRFYETESMSETISGIGSRGPYALKSQDIVKNSEKVFVDGKEFFPDLDYTMDYALGKITFRYKIASTSVIEIEYLKIKARVQQKTADINSVKIGATYLKESAKKGAGAATATKVETHKGSELVNGLLSLKNFPLDPNQPIVVKVNGVDYTNFYVPTSDAQSLPLPYITDSSDPTDGYATGTLKFGTTIQASDEITVLYTYQKSIFGKFTGYGNGSQGPYYITNMPQMVPGSDASLLVRAEGSSVIETYTKNSSKTLTDGKYKINYNCPYIPYITFNEPFPADKIFEISFYYVPSSGSFQESDINHDALGITSSISISDKAKIDSAFGISRTDRPQIYESQTDTFVGNNTRGPYQLSKTNIIEGSEMVYVNGFKQNKDIDYFMNYSTGQITFYYLTLTSNDNISVEYNYQSTSGISTDTQIITGKAFRINGTVQPIDSLSVGGIFKEIEPEFSQFESTNIGAGSQQKGINLSYSPQSFYSFSGSILETKNQKGTFKGFYTWNTDRNASLNLDLNIVKMNLGYRNYKALDDITPGSTTNSVNTVSNVFSGSIVPKTIEIGIASFTNSNSFSKNDTSNYLNNTSTLINYFNTSNSLKLTDRFSFGVNYQFSEPISSTSEGISAHSISKDYSYDAFWDLKFGSINNFSARGKIITHDQKDLIKSTTNMTKNQSINLVLEPTSNISTSLTKSRAETLSVQQDKPNPFTENNNYSIRFVPFSNLSINYSNSDDRSYQESGARNNGITSSVSTTFTPFSFLRLGFNFNNLNRDTTSVSGTIETTTNQKSESQSYTAGITLRPLNLINLTSDFVFENYKNNNQLGNINTETQNITTRTGISFSPLPIVTVSGNYSKKITRDILLQKESPKENWDSSAAIRVLNLGTLTYNWAQERNLGEVQAGAVASLDILKITNELSFSSTIPQSSPVLSSIVLSANYKTMVYSDNLNSTNSFTAQYLTFEGTLNF